VFRMLTFWADASERLQCLTSAADTSEQVTERAPSAREAAALRRQSDDSERAAPAGAALRIPHAGRAGALLLSAKKQ
jgi:hypothetical protein